MKQFYLSKDRVLYLLLALLFIFLMGWWGLGLFFLACSLLYFFLYRKVNTIKIHGQRESKGLIKSPVNGRIVSIREGVEHNIFGQDLIEIALVIPHFFEFGFYLPVSGEIEYSKTFPSLEYFRYKQKWQFDQAQEVYGGVLMGLRSEEEHLIGLQMVKCFLGLAPQIWVLPGDRGSIGSRFGYFPLGGSLLCYLPKSYNVISRVGDELRAGESIVAKASME